MKEGIEQDHFYEKREGNTTAEPYQTGIGGKEKAERFPLPDGTIPPAESDIGTSKRDKDVYHERPRSEMAKEP
jgi:aarF domain-containing kinase